MFVGVHACLPLIAAGTTEWWRVSQGRQPVFSKANLFVIGLAGLSPDLLSPHWGLAARHASLAHSFWYPLIAVGLVAMTVLPPLRRWFQTALFAWMGVVMHLGCDLISGGIPLLGTDRAIVGAIYIHSASWLHLDIAAVLLTWFIFFRVRFLAAGRKAFPTTCSWEERILEWWQGEETLASAEEERLAKALEQPSTMASAEAVAKDSPSDLGRLDDPRR